MQVTDMDVGGGGAALGASRDFSTLSEDEQMAYALQMSMQPGILLLRHLFIINNIYLLSSLTFNFTKTQSAKDRTLITALRQCRTNSSCQ